MKKLLLFPFIIFFCYLARSQSAEHNKLDAFFSILEKHNKFMGSVAVFKGDSIIYNEQFGFSEVGKKTKAKQNTKYRIGSISKTFTAVLVFKAIEQGKLKLTDTLENYFPSIKNANQITISDLLNHRSGIHSFTDDKDDYLSFNTKFNGEEKMITMISKYGSDFEPNSQAAYSNSNYLLLSYILEEVHNKNFAIILNEEITKPFNLRHTYYTEYLSNENDEAYSYVIKNREWKEESQTNGSNGLGAGSIVSTPKDLIEFSIALFDGEIISETHLRMMKTIKDSFGMGLFQTNYYDTVSYGHNGGIDGFVSMFKYFPKEKMAFAVTANGLKYDFNKIEVTVVKSMFDKYFDVPVFGSYNHSSKELNLYLGLYSNETFPVKLNVKKSRKQLVVQVEGQESMYFEAIAKGKFKLDAAGIVIQFFPEKNEMHIEQGGKTSILKKD